MDKNHQSPDTSDNVYTAYETDTSEHLCLLPSKSSLHIHEKITKDDVVAVVTVTKLINMAVCHLFEEVRYELNGVEIDRNKNVGITSTMKGYTSATENFKITLNKIEWLLPYIKLADKPKIQLLNYIVRDPAISMSFRSRETYVYPMLPSTTRHIWSVKTSTQLEKPRYVVLGFQTAKRNEPPKNAGVFDHCRIRDVKLFLNSQCYPYGNINIDIVAWHFYCAFHTAPRTLDKP
ncbi:uncharacterized protein [Neodiprion pinetum]|uniref:uncharacterized protein n=1 Tax=Neodiprion pinetum TaxID=441929 RepID=UPI003723575B